MVNLWTTLPLAKRVFAIVSFPLALLIAAVIGYNQKVCEPEPRIARPVTSYTFELDDDLAVTGAIEFVNLVADYYANSRERSLIKAISMAKSPQDLETKIKEGYRSQSAHEIESQRLYISLSSVSLSRKDAVMTIDIFGLLKRKKSSKVEEVLPVHYVVSATTVPANPAFPYGISVFDYKVLFEG